MNATCPSCGSELAVGSGGATLAACPGCRSSVLTAGAVEAPLKVRGADGAVADSGSVRLSPSFRERFRLEVLLGAGASGTVYRARELATGRAVAVKFLVGEVAPLLHRRFLQEGRLFGQIAHPNVVELIEVNDAGGVPFLVVEYVDGGTLRDLMARERKLDPKRAVELTLQILDALAACHALGIVHRDLKPENVLLTREGRVKVADLGVAKDSWSEEGQLTAPGVILGTPIYMAPEQLRGEDTSPAFDLWAAGVVLYEMLTAEQPFRDRNLAGVIAKVEAASPPLVAAHALVTPELSAFVHRMLAREPAARPASARAAMAELERVTGRREPARADPRGRAIAGGIGVTFALILAAALAGSRGAPSLRPLGVVSLADSGIEGQVLTYRSEPDGADMVQVPGLACYLDRHEVTAGQFARYVRATGAVTDAERDGSSFDWRRPLDLPGELPDHDRRPVVHVSWKDALGYCRWAGKRLPTAAEWEHAARGGLVNQRYPWGAEPPAGRACFGLPAQGRPAAVASFPPNGYGLHEMAGNVAEWCDGGTARGGSWRSEAGEIAVEAELAVASTYHGSDVGFRCALSAR